MLPRPRDCSLCPCSSVSTQPGSTAVTRTPARRALLAERLGEPDDPPLGHVVDPAAHRGDSAGDRGDVDDVARARRAHDRQRRMGAVEEPEQVDVDHLPPLLGRRSGHRPEQHQPGVVDEDVEAAELVVGPRDEGVGLLLVGDIGLDRQGGAIVAGDPAGEIVDPVLATGGQRDARPPRRRARARSPRRSPRRHRLPPRPCRRAAPIGPRAYPSEHGAWSEEQGGPCQASGASLLLLPAPDP